MKQLIRIAVGLLPVAIVSVSPALAGDPPCGGVPYYGQAPNPDVRLWSQEDPCAEQFIQVADAVPGDGEPISGFRWWGAYQHAPGQPPSQPTAFVIELREYLGAPGPVIEAHYIEDFDEVRDPENDGWTSATYCAHLQNFFETQEDQQYVVSIFPVLCGPEQWTWTGSNEGDGEAWVFAPLFGGTDWEFIPENVSLEVMHPLAGIDITKTDLIWMPTEDNTTTYTSKIYWVDPRSGECIYPGPDKNIRFRLLESSSERGYCINAGERTHTDLHFNHPENGEFTVLGAVPGECDLFNGPHDHWTDMITMDCVTEATITLWSEDYGSYGMIEASAEGCNPITVAGLLPREPGGETSCTWGPPTVRVPRDDDGNEIADIWIDNAYMGTSATWDEETQPNPESRSKGDGLTRYEEYRGAVYRRANGTADHQRLQVSRKEIAVYRENTLYPAEDLPASADVIDVFADGINGALHDGSPGTTNPARGPRIFNCNRTSNTLQDQHGLWLAVSGGDGDMGNWGLTRSNTGTDSGPIGPPRVNGRVEIYLDNINSACAPAARRFRFGVGAARAWANWNSNGQARADEIIRDTIGHELGHAHALVHHTDRWIWYSRAPYNFRDLTDRPFTGWYEETSASTLTSCVMQYKFHDIQRALQLRYNGVLRAYQTVDSDWTPTLPQTNAGYGAGCTTLDGTTCNTNTRIKD